MTDLDHDERLPAGWSDNLDSIKIHQSPSALRWLSRVARLAPT